MNNKYSSAGHPAPQPGGVAGDAVRRRPDRRRSAEAAGRHLQHVVRGQHLQHASRPAGRADQGRRAGGGPGRAALQHHRRQRRHLDGHRGHELFAAVARPDCRFDRDGGRRAVVRRGDHRAGLRQEHAGVGHRDAAAQSAVDHGLRRNDPGRASRRASRATSSRRSSRTASTSRASSPTSSASTSSSTRALARARAAACTPRTRWRRRSRRWACRCRTARRIRPRIPAKADECRRAGAAIDAARARPQAARHRHQEIVRERAGDGDGGRRIDQRRAAPDRDRADARTCRWRWTTSSARAIACRCWPI